MDNSINDGNNSQQGSQIKGGMLAIDTDSINNSSIANSANSSVVGDGNNPNHQNNSNNNNNNNNNNNHNNNSGSNTLSHNNGGGSTNNLNNLVNGQQDLSRPSTSNNSQGNLGNTRPSNKSLLASTSLPPMMKNNKNVLIENPGMVLPLSKTYLEPLLERPGNIRQLIKRQNNVEKLNAQEISPQMTLFLTTMSSTSIDKDGKDIEIDSQHSKQTFRRTIPVNWCAAGGTDTHQKRVVHTDLHNDISSKLKVSQQEYLHHTYHFHHAKISAVRDNQKTLEKVRWSLLLFPSLS
jgi:hypothetical protein